MNRPLTTAELQRLQAAAPVAQALTRTEMLTIAANAFAQRQNQDFKTLVDVEHMEEATLRAHPTTGTAFEVIENALGNHGIVTDGTVGGIMGVIDLNQPEVDYFACFCNHGAKMTGNRAMTNLQHIGGRVDRMTSYLSDIG